MIKEYRKTAPIHAVQWDGSTGSTSFIHRWTEGTVVPDVSFMDSDVGKQVLRIPTLEGPMYASVGDFIAKGVSNEFWAIKPDIMAKTYEEVKLMIPYNDQCQYCGTNFVGTGPTVDDAYNECRSKIADHEKTCDDKP